MKRIIWDALGLLLQAAVLYGLWLGFQSWGWWYLGLNGW